MPALPAESQPITPADAARLLTGRCFLIGIGGCGMSGLAREIIARGGRVRGVDATLTEVTGSLEREGVPVGVDDGAASIPDRCDAVIASAAVRQEHRLIREARRRRIPVLTYAEALGACMAGRTGVAVAGTHGKSTTAAILGAALIEAGLDPSVIVGAESAALAAPGEPARGHRVGAGVIPAGPLAGKPGVFVAEACEFNRSFHRLRPTVATIGSVEADHLDVYGSLDAVIEAFARFVRLLPGADEGGRLIIAHEGAHRRRVAAGARCAVETIGVAPEADWRVRTGARGEVTLSRRGGRPLVWINPMPGEHNAMNAAIAAAAALTLGAGPGAVASALARFPGVRRRCERLGDRPLARGGSVRVYDDYGHHPTEIDATLRAVRAREGIDDRGGRLVCVFQPHQHSRTRFLLEDFARAFARADEVIVPPIYFVRDSEVERSRVCSADLVERLGRAGVAASHEETFEAIVDRLDRTLRPGDTLVVMGAGPVWKIARSFMARAAREPAA
ncbi:MAG: UDP-N-acetylmuramate--L-alanine ligase [Planctomycetota bacterium]|nr:MAG: UDP-N-acetylmuramate--L-alanine ligase [Planctomycetota bacterium]